ncbi:hypothetical protein PCASD_04757 [Puccinia coronata f. sp. avenae]|uniref:Uncharacterized protein n=1 Tax=Puccinia coronata f. sp. avenae TaxID=200324 RepID=A0A2N5V721_9BASI|nr:hypothetical protein PCASD_04757 [Puccinia coronata f. sp. avenae]
MAIVAFWGLARLAELTYHTISGPAPLSKNRQTRSGAMDPGGLIAAHPKGVRTPPQTPKKRRAGAARLPNQAFKPPHPARRPHAYKWREDGRLGVRPRRTGVLAMHACPEGVQALHALRTGVYGRHACVPAVHTCPEGVQGLHALRKGVHGQHACLAGPHAKPAVLTPFVGMRTAFGGACARPSGVPLSSPWIQITEIGGPLCPFAAVV